jgi:hypothetical protein
VYAEVCQAIGRCQNPAIAKVRPQGLEAVRKRPNKAVSTYGLNGSQFAGLGLALVRKGIEELPGVAMQVVLGAYHFNRFPGDGPYRFCYKLPALVSQSFTVLG